MVATAQPLPLAAAAEGDAAKKSSKVEPSSRGWKGADPANSPVAPSVANDYTIGPGDVLSIQVRHEPDISRIGPVRPDGRISLPLIGEVEAQGSTTVQLRSRIAEKLQAYVSHPDVAVIVQEVRSPTFNVVGQVVRPGAYTLLKPLSVEVFGVPEHVHRNDHSVIQTEFLTLDIRVAPRKLWAATSPLL